MVAQREVSTENVIFGALIVAAIAVTAVMGWLTCSEPPRDPDRTIQVLTASAPDSIQIQKRLTEEYKRLRPEITVEVISFPYQSIWRKLEFMIVAGIPPDVTGIEQPNLPKFIHLGAIEPLDDWIRNDAEFDPSSFFPKCMDEGNWDGIQYAVPDVVSPVCLWYNKALFDREGLAYPTKNWTLEDLVANAKKLTRDTNGDGLTDQYGFYTNNNHWNRYPCWVWMKGGEFMSPDQRRCLFNSPETVAAIHWLADLALKEKCAPSWGFLSNISAPNLFMAGRLAMTTETRYFLTNFFLAKNREKIREFEWDVCELPHDETRATTFICGLTVMPRTLSPERKKRAWDYIKFLSSETGQNVYAEVNNGLPARMDVARRMVNHPGVPPENDIAFINAIDYARYFYWPFPSDEAFAAARSEFMGVWTGKLQVEDVCRRVSYSITRSVDDFFRKNPGAHLPVKTKWVPFDKRPPAEPTQ